jgi:hypothetical protein
MSKSTIEIWARREKGSGGQYENMHVGNRLLCTMEIWARTEKN